MSTNETNKLLLRYGFMPALDNIADYKSLDTGVTKMRVFIGAVSTLAAFYNHIVKIIAFYILNILNFCVARTTAYSIIAKSFVHGGFLSQNS